MYFIPIGTNYYNAYYLRRLSIRKSSNFFDWLYIGSENNFHLYAFYIYINILTNFQFVLDDIITNKRNLPISQNFPYIEFTHNNILNQDEYSTMKRRKDRFIKTINNCEYIYLFNFRLNEKFDENNKRKVILLNTYLEKIKTLISNTIIINISLIRPKEISNNDKEEINEILKSFKVFYIKWTDNCDNGWGNNDNYEKFINSLNNYLKDNERYTGICTDEYQDCTLDT